jgi:hypothetical protein
LCAFFESDDPEKLYMPVKKQKKKEKTKQQVPVVFIAELPSLYCIH